MASSRDIRRRIRSISSTSQITKAMQMVAASKMRKAQQLAIDARPFARLLYRIQRTATTHLGDFTHPLLEKREVRKRAVVLVASDKGLCGALNSNVFRLAGRFDPKSTVFITAGRKASQFVARTRRELVAEFPYGDTPHFAESRAIASLARDLFLKRDVDQVQLVTTRFVNTLTQVPTIVDFLPIGDVSGADYPGRPTVDELRDGREFLFEPDVESVTEFMLGIYLNIFMHFALLNAKASEQSARMVSMKGATDNATEMIRDLTLEYNKLRQNRITQELLEIAGGQAG
ncbi:MAG TPA: ATP synthase F1 subunit gamma [Vicinamibacterales bacterium]|jgi:F-type H+-transporting ATPase subunit gamma